MLSTRRRDTPGELAIRAELRRLGVPYRINVKLPVTRRTADVGFTRLKVAVFIDGCFWHGCPTHGTWPKANAAWWRQKINANKARDSDTDTKLRKAGWRVLRFWAHEDPSLAAVRILRAVRLRRELARRPN